MENKLQALETATPSLISSTKREQIISIQRELSLEQAVLRGTRIAYLVKQGQREPTHHVIYECLADLNEYYNVRVGLSSEAAVELTGHIIERYNEDTLEDIILALRMAKAGELEPKEIYDRIGPDTVYAWVTAYLDRKAKFIEDRRQNEKVTHGDNLTRDIAEAIPQEALDKFKAKLDAREADRANNSAKGTANTMQAQIRHTRAYMAEFSTDQLKELRAQYERNNTAYEGANGERVAGCYDEVIQDIDNELNNR